MELALLIWERGAGGGNWRPSSVFIKVTGQLGQAGGGPCITAKYMGSRI